MLRRIGWIILFGSSWLALVGRVPVVDEAVYVKVFVDLCSLDDCVEKVLKAGVLAYEVLREYGKVRPGLQDGIRKSVGGTLCEGESEV